MTMPTNPIAAAAEEIAGFFRTLGPPTDDTLAHDTKVVAQILTRHFAPAAAIDEGEKADLTAARAEVERLREAMLSARQRYHDHPEAAGESAADTFTWLEAQAAARQEG